MPLGRRISWMIALGMICLLPFVAGAHFICGTVNDAALVPSAASFTVPQMKCAPATKGRRHIMPNAIIQLILRPSGIRVHPHLISLRCICCKVFANKNVSYKTYISLCDLVLTVPDADRIQRGSNI